MLRTAGALALFVVLPPVPLLAQPIELVKEGRSTYSICLSAGASPSERRGAEELQKFLEEMSGARLPIVTESTATGDLILVGRSGLVDTTRPAIRFESLGDEGFTIRASGRRLVLRRTISFGSDGSVRTRASVQNAGAADIGVALQSRADLDPGRSGNAVVTFRRQDGAAWERQLTDLDRDPAGPENHVGSTLPDGEWRLVGGGPRQASVIRFARGQAERAFTSWSLRTTRSVTLGLWSPVRRLKPGEELRLDFDVNASVGIQ